MSTIQRVTGMNSGLDVDSLVKSAMQPYKTKVNTEVQNEKVLEYQQEQYKQIISDASNFYDKYFDILKTGNMMSTSSYQSETFTSSDGSKVTAKGLAGASIDNYTVSVTQLAAKATDKLDLATETGTAKTIKIGTASTITFDVVADGNTTVANYNKAISDRKNALNAKATLTDAEKAELTELNSNTITAKYSEFSNSVVFTASAFGGDGFTLNNHSQQATDKYLEATIKNSSGTVYTINSIDKKTSNTVTVDNVQFDFKAVGASTSTTPAASLNAVSAITPAAVGGDVNPLTELTALAENGSTTTSTATDGTKTTTTTSGTITTTKVTTSSGDTTTTTTDTSKPGVTSVVDKYGMITTTDTSNAGYTLTTVKAGTTTTTTKTNADGTIPITKKIETSGTTTTTTYTLKNGSTTTVEKDVNDGVAPTKTTTTKQQAPDGTTTTVVGTDGTTTTTQVKVGADGKTTKTVTTSNGTPTTELAALTNLTNLTNLTALTNLPDNGTTQTDVNGIKTTTTADGTKTVTDTNTGIITTTAADGTQTVTAADGTKTTTKGAITTVAATDGTITTSDGTKTTTTKTDGTITTTLADGTKTVTDTNTGIITTTVADGTQTVTAADGTKTTTKGAITTVTATDGTITTTNGGISTVTTATTYGTPTSLTGSTDVSDLKDKIVKFVNDYNTLLQSISTKIFETRDKNYMPLTDDQKASMTDSQITAWEKKAQTGLLRKDNDLQRITSAMKSAMSSVMSGTGLYLEKIGISPVQDYADKNGMLTVDEGKLTQALEDNAGDVKDLFTRAASTTDKGGVLTQLAATLKSEFKTSSSSLSQKVGLDGMSTQYNNTLTTSITKKKQLISDLNKSLTDKENALYKKYSDLETAMQKLNSQQSSLTSMLGQG